MHKKWELHIQKNDWFVQGFVLTLCQVFVLLRVLPLEIGDEIAIREGQSLMMIPSDIGHPILYFSTFSFRI